MLEWNADGGGDPGWHLLVVVLTGVVDQDVGTEQVDERGEFDQLGRVPSTTVAW